MKRHKFNVTDAIHYGFQEWMILREKKPSLTPVSSAQSETLASEKTAYLSWEEIRCRFLIDTPQKKHDCLSKNPPIKVMHPLILPEVCKACQNEAEEIKQVAKTLATYNLNARTKAPIAQAIHGLEIQLGITQEGCQHKEQIISNWRTRYDEECAKNKALKQQNQELLSREANLCSRESALEETDKEYSEKREALQELPAIKKQVETLETENGILEADNRFLRNQVEEKSKEAQQKCESLTSEKAILEAENRDLKENPMVLCPDERLVRLSFCTKTCNKFLDCGVYMTNYQLSKHTLNEKPFQC
jgi:hypothetical protein